MTVRIRIEPVLVVAGALLLTAILTPIRSVSEGHGKMLEDALSAAGPGMQASATVVDWEGNVLKEGDNKYTCLPTPPGMSGNAPMCMDHE